MLLPACVSAKNLAPLARQNQANLVVLARNVQAGNQLRAKLVDAVGSAYVLSRIAAIMDEWNSILDVPETPLSAGDTWTMRMEKNGDLKAKFDQIAKARADSADRRELEQMQRDAGWIYTAQANADFTPAKAKQSPVERVDAHIKSLHDRLQITAAQEPQWGAVAQAMRDSAEKMQAAIQQRQAAKMLTAVDDLKAYQTIADAHSQGLQQLVPAFEALYATMSDDQKKNADTVFSQSRKHRRASK
jgi:hypothetical protein